MSRLDGFAAEIGCDEPLVIAGGRTRWSVGGDPDPGARVVRAPSAVVEHDPAEMIVIVGAGTPLDELDAVLAESGQQVALEGPPGATVGGTLMVGAGGVRRRGQGPVRNTVLQLDYVSAEGRVVQAGGPTVKNVSGYDLCRLFVGSLGTLGFVAELRLRTRPRPEASRWVAGAMPDPVEVERGCYRPMAHLWNGATSWVLLEGYAVDVDAEAGRLAALGLQPTDAPPTLPSHRHSVRPTEIIDQEGSFVAEIGVGVVHRHEPPRRPDLDPTSAALGRQMKAEFDPTGRCNPGRDPHRIGSPV